MLLIFPLEVVQTSFYVLCFSFDNFLIVNFRSSEEVCEMGGFVFAGVILFPFRFESFFFVADMRFLSRFFEFWQLSFGLSVKSTHEIKICRNGT